MKIQADFLSRSSLIWLIVALVAALIPHFDRFPIWIVVSTAVVVFWRFMMHLGRWPKPNEFIKLILVSGSFAGVYFSYGLSFSLESMIALLAAGAILKPLEAYSRRDTYILIFMSYFLASTEFLFDQSLLMTLYMLWVFLLIVTSQVSLNQGKESAKGAHAVALKLTLQSIPLAIVLFIFLPRLGPLWSINLNTQSATTGLSDSMSPGDIARLSQSTDLAFRVEVIQDEGSINQLPQQSDLYWRALILDQFDGKTWSASNWSRRIDWASPQIFQKEEMTGPYVKYGVLAEASDQRWLFGLDKAQALTRGTGLTADYRVVSKDKLIHKKSYELKSYLDASLGGGELAVTERRINVSLPKKGNEQARALVKSLQLTSKSDEEFVEKIKQFYLSNPFRYTLKPDPLGDVNTVDSFLFDTQGGFCAHFAGSFTYLMRLAGIPTRVVTGYQGGEFNLEGNYWAIYQYSAHAWAEYWLPQKGWIRIDPTGWVAPDRIELGLEEAVQDEFLADALISMHKLKQWPWVNKIRQQFEALNYEWNRSVIGFDNTTQQDLLKKLLGDSSGNYYGLIFFSLMVICVGGVFAIILFVQRAPLKPPLVRLHDQLRQRLIKAGLDVSNNQSTMALLKEAAIFFPANKSECEKLAGIIEKYLYGSSSQSLTKRDIRVLTRRIQRLKWRN